MMYIRTISRNETQACFELIKNNGKEFLFVRIDGDETNKFKKNYIADYLEMISNNEGSITWVDLDIFISEVMNAPVHIF